MSAYDDNNIFAKILRGEIPATKIFENEHCLAIMDAFPQSRGHSLIIPKAASQNLFDADPDNLALVIPYVQKLARAAKSALGADGIRVVQLNEVPAGQSVFHLHWHVIPAYEGTELGPHGAESSSVADADELVHMAKLIAAEL